MPNVTERDIAEIRSAAEAGDEVAKAALAVLPKETAPEPAKAELAEEVKVGTEEKPKIDVKAEMPEQKSKAPMVDQTQEKPENPARERVHPAVRRLDREKRQQARELAELRAEVAELRKARETQPPKNQETEADDLNKLLTNPSAYLAERDRRLIEKLTKQNVEEQRRIATESARRQVEEENALKILDNIEGYNDRRDSDEMLSVVSDYLNKVQDTDEYDEDIVLKEWTRNPLKMAKIFRLAWMEARKLSDTTQSDKKAATAAQTQAGKTGGSKLPSLEDLNAQLADANAKGDRKLGNEILDKIAIQLGEKK